MVKIIAQAISIVAMVAMILSFQIKKQRTLIIVNSIGAALFCASYFMLGAIMGGLLNAINVIKGIIYSNKKLFKSEHPAYVIAFGVLAVVSYVLTFTVFAKPLTAKNVIIELLPVVGVVLQTISFAKKDARSVRFLNLAISPCWLVYNSVCHSIGGIISEIFCLSSTVIGIVRLDVKKTATSAATDATTAGDATADAATPTENDEN